MAHLKRQEIATYGKTDVNNIPHSDIGKVMYYLNSVCNCIDCEDNDIQRYRNYSDWSSLNDEEDQLVFLLALILNPDLLIEKVLFQNDTLTRGMDERFYKIDQIKNQIVIIPSFIVAGRTYQIRQILTFKQIWIVENYLEPMARLAQRFCPWERSKRFCVIL
jgi:hypothetical protein